MSVGLRNEHFADNWTTAALTAFTVPTGETWQVLKFSLVSAAGSGGPLQITARTSGDILIFASSHTIDFISNNLDVAFGVTIVDRSAWRGVILEAGDRIEWSGAGAGIDPTLVAVLSIAVKT